MLATKRSARKDLEEQKETNRREFSRQLNIVKQIGNLLAELLQIGDFSVLSDTSLNISFQPPTGVGHWEQYARKLSAQLAVRERAEK
jgi:hypothetical protein